MNSKRLRAIASLIDKSDVVVDIGCDHAYLDIYLIENKLCKQAIAADISERAIAQAQKNIQKHNLSDQIKTVISDGLWSIDEEINTTVISGMGANTILEILDNPKVKNIHKFIIQSNNNIGELRALMNKRNFKIIKEIVVCENNKYYTIILYNHGKENLSPATIELGLYNHENIEYYNYLYNKNIKLLNKIPWYKVKKRISILTLLIYLKKYKKHS